MIGMAETKGSGSIIQLEKDKPKSRCRKWQLRVRIGKDPRTGKYKARTRHFEGAYTQAKAALREFIDEAEGDRARVRRATRSRSMQSATSSVASSTRR